nr:winged helix-turn-helix transcriptional regulator [Candidatus Sigynarchaeota archaeon]
MQLSGNDNTAAKLDSLEQSILLIAKQMISRHYLLSTKALYAECTRTMKDVDHNKIEIAITNLLTKKILLDGKAITRENLLENENRAAIYYLIRADPGIYLYKIMTRMNIDSRTANWHLHMLEEFSLIRSTRIGNNTIYFDASVDHGHEIVHYYMHKQSAPDIFRAILTNPGISFTQLLTVVNLPRSTLIRKVKTLINEGIFTGINDARELSSITISEKYRDIINILINKRI